MEPTDTDETDTDTDDEEPTRVRISPAYQPHSSQLRFHQSGARFLAAAAGVRGGKTYGASVEFVLRIFRDVAAGRGRAVSGTGKRRRPRLHYWVIAPTFDLLREPMRYVFEAVPPELIEEWYETEKALWIVGDVLIEFKSADNPHALVSTGLDGMWIDEAARVKADAWRGQLRQRLSDREGWALFSTTPLGRNWVYDDLVQRSGADGIEVVTWTTADNPAISAAEIEHARRTLPRQYFVREYEASFEAFIGQVFDEFSERAHVVSLREFDVEFPHRRSGQLFRRVVAGVDWGWQSPGAIVVVGDLGGRWVVLDESYATNRIVFDPRLDSGTWVTEAKRLVAKWGVSGFYCDPARPDAIFDFQRAGLSVFAGDNEILFGVRKIHEALHVLDGAAPRLRILSQCTNLIREVRGYQWAQQKGGVDFLDRPADGQSDHALDALRYVMTELMRFETQARAPGFSPARSYGIG